MKKRRGHAGDLFFFVRLSRFELLTSCLSSKRSKPTELKPRIVWECEGKDKFRNSKNFLYKPFAFPSSHIASISARVISVSLRPFFSVFSSR